MTGIDVLDLAPTAGMSAQPDVTLGYVPLVDCAPLVVADALGFFAARGARVDLHRAPSWSALRDRLAIGAIDGAQMLSPLPIAAQAGLGGVRAELRVVSTLGRNGNTIVLGERLAGDVGPMTGPLSAEAFAAGLARRRARGEKPPVLAAVFAFSSHHYLLRHWLAGGGIDPDRDVRLTVVPPPRVAERLADGDIDGFCAGEPWGSRAVDLRAGRIALATGDIWPNHPEKVFAVSDRLLRERPERVTALVAALIDAGAWLDDPGNRDHAIRILHDRALNDVPTELIAMALSGLTVVDPDRAPRALPRAAFHRDGASFPDPVHGAWWLAAMRRWGHLREPPDHLAIERIWRPDIWRAAMTLRGERVTEPACTLPDQPPEH